MYKLDQVTSPAIGKRVRVFIREIRVSFIPGAIMGVPIDEYKMLCRLDNHPIVNVPLWESTPASDGDKRTTKRG